MLAVTIAAVLVLLLCFNVFIVTLVSEMHEILYADYVIQKKYTGGFTYFKFAPIWFYSCSPLDSYSRLMLPITATRGLERDGLSCLPWKSDSGECVEVTSKVRIPL